MDKPLKCNPMNRPLTRSEFRDFYKEIRERTTICFNAFDEEKPCRTPCHYWLTFDPEVIDADGKPEAFGIDCKVEVLGWAGYDEHDVPIEAYCKKCSRLQHMYDEEWRIEEELRLQKRNAIERRRHEETHRRERAVPDYWKQISGLKLESECKSIFETLGFQAKTTPHSNDGGIDLVLKKDGKHGAAQCKAWKQPCGVKVIREFYGALCAEKMTFGYLIALSGLTCEAERFRIRTGMIEVWNVGHLIEHAKAMVAPVGKCVAGI
jgi:hypothetical protein